MCALYHFLENEEGEQERKGGCPSGGGGEQVRKEEGRYGSARDVLFFIGPS